MILYLKRKESSCFTCKSVFTSDEMLDNHKCTKGTEKCLFCDCSFQLKISLMTHFLENHVSMKDDEMVLKLDSGRLIERNSDKEKGKEWDKFVKGNGGIENLMTEEFHENLKKLMKIKKD